MTAWQLHYALQPCCCHRPRHVISSIPFTPVIFMCNYRCLCPCQLVFTIRHCSGVQCSVTVLPTKKVKASHPHKRVTFSPMLLWSQIQSKKKHRGWEEIRECFFSFSFFSTILSLCEKVHVHSLYGQHKFMFHQNNTLASLIHQHQKYGFLPAEYWFWRRI